MSGCQTLAPTENLNTPLALPKPGNNQGDKISVLGPCLGVTGQKTENFSKNNFINGHNSVTV